jgi:hypothetical protein
MINAVNHLLMYNPLEVSFEFKHLDAYVKTAACPAPIRLTNTALALDNSLSVFLRIPPSELPDTSIYQILRAHYDKITTVSTNIISELQQYHLAYVKKVSRSNQADNRDVGALVDMSMHLLLTPQLISDDTVRCEAHSRQAWNNIYAFSLLLDVAKPTSGTLVNCFCNFYLTRGRDQYLQQQSEIYAQLKAIVTDFLQNEYLKDAYDLKNLHDYTLKCVHCPTVSLLMLQAATEQGEELDAKLARFRSMISTIQQAFEHDTTSEYGINESILIITQIRDICKNALHKNTYPARTDELVKIHLDAEMLIISLIELVQAQEQNAQTAFSYEEPISPLPTRPATAPSQNDDPSQLGDGLSESVSVTSSLRSTHTATREITVLSTRLFNLLDSVVYPDEVLPIRIMRFSLAGKKKSAFYVVTSELREYMQFYKGALSSEDYKIIEEDINKSESKHTLHTLKMVLVSIPEDLGDNISDELLKAPTDELTKASPLPSAPAMAPTVRHLQSQPMPSREYVTHSRPSVSFDPHQDLHFTSIEPAISPTTRRTSAPLYGNESDSSERRGTFSFFRKDPIFASLSDSVNTRQSAHDMTGQETPLLRKARESGWLEEDPWKLFEHL